MNKISGSGKLPVGMLILGMAALVLRRLLYTFGVDARGLLIRNHPLELALATLTAAVFVLVALSARRQKGPDAGEGAVSPSLPAACGNLAAAAGVLLTVLTAAPGTAGYLGQAWRVLGQVSPVCFALAGIARGLGKKPFFLLHVAACLFFVLHIVTRYQGWSGDPQMQDYVFSLLGAMALMFFCFYTAAMEADCGNPRMRTGMGLAAVYLCTAELARSYCPALYLGGLIWALTELYADRE